VAPPFSPASFVPLYSTPAVSFFIEDVSSDLISIATGKFALDSAREWGRRSKVLFHDRRTHEKRDQSDYIDSLLHSMLVGMKDIFLKGKSMRRVTFVGKKFGLPALNVLNFSASLTRILAARTSSMLNLQYLLHDALSIQNVIHQSHRRLPL
jgi:hypothetical protein